MVVFVSGRSSGIGRAIAEKFLNEGAEVVGFDIACSAVEHPCYRHVIHDIRDGEIPDLPAPEIVINSAGTINESEAIDVNLKGAIRFVGHFLGSPVLRSVLFIASASARNGAEFPLYVASKAGIIGFTKSVAKEYGSKGITVNAVAPGFIQTAMTDKLPENVKEAYLKQIPVGRFGQPEDIANVVEFLASDKAAYVTGQVVEVTGGM